MMHPTRFQSSLAAAERALGRLDAALADPLIRRRHRADARRRAVCAALRLDDCAVSADDLRLIEVAPEVVAPEARPDARLGAALLRWSDALDPGHVFAGSIPHSASAPAGHPVPRSPRRRTGPAAGGLHHARGGHSPPLSPWTASWARMALTGWADVQERPRPGAEAAEALVDGVAAVTRTLAAAPGLDGALRVVVQLHHRGDPPLPRPAGDGPTGSALTSLLRQDAHPCPPAGFWSTLVRLGAPSLLRRACGLMQAELPLVVSLAASPTLFRAMLVASDEMAVGWLLDRVAQQAEAELERLAILEQRAAARRATLQGRRRDAGAWALVERLEEEPALTLGHAARHLDCSERATRMTLNVMTAAGILRPLPAWRESAEGQQRMVRPLVWLAADTVLERPAAIKPLPRRVQRRKDQAMPPPGTAMHWQPIASAPLDGKRCLVWAGRPALAAFASPAPGAPPVWREGRRILQPTHWLPLAPPGCGANTD